MVGTFMQTRANLKQMDLANTAKSLEVNQAIASAKAMADAGFGPDPRTGIVNPRTDWDPNTFPGMTPDANASPLAGYLRDPTSRMAMQLDPKAVLGGIVKNMTAPAVPYSVIMPDGTDKSGMYTPTQVLKFQAQGARVNEREKDKGFDPNSPVQTVETYDSLGRKQPMGRIPGTTQFAPLGGPAPLQMQSDPGKEWADQNAILALRRGGTYGGGQSLGGGSGAPNIGGQTPSTQPTFGGGAGTIQTPAAAPRPAVPSAPAPFIQPPTPSSSTPGAAPDVTVPTDPFELAAFNRRMTALNLARQAQGISPKPFGYDAEQAQKKAENKSKAKAQIEAVERIIDQTKKVLMNPAHRSVTGPWQGSKWVPSATFALPFVGPSVNEKSTAANDIETLTSQTQVEGLQKIRQSSPTGGAGGQVTEAEWPKFGSLFGNLKSTSGDEDFNTRLGELLAHSQKTLNELRQAYQIDYGTPYSPGIENLVDKYAPR